LRAGPPDLAFEKAVQMEHCKKGGHDYNFETTNYKIKTTSEKEYKIVVGEETVNPADMMHSRRIPNLVELQGLEMSTKAGLIRIEIIMLVLYTGPMVCSIVHDFLFSHSHFSPRAFTISLLFLLFLLSYPSPKHLIFSQCETWSRHSCGGLHEITC
jgi:hypothetical protein